MKHGCDNCKYRFFPVTRSPCDNCAMSGNKYSEWTALTNADRIRSMTDEELADEIVKCVLADLFRLNVIGTRPNTKEEWLKWLKEEVKE